MIPHRLSPGCMIAWAIQNLGLGAACDIQRNLSELFASDNPRFDAERFAKACEPGSGK